MATIRPARPGDAEALSRLAADSEARWGFSDAFLDRFREAYRITPDYLARNPTFVAEEDGELAGFYALVPGGGAWELEFLYVAPGRMGAGLGARLWRHMVDACREQGVREVRLVCGPEPLPFYLRMGAKVVGETRSKLDPGRRILELVYLPPAGEARIPAGT
jgi:N-acetylglutamate synthase-like GNAT family acetyltransferase